MNNGYKKIIIIGSFKNLEEDGRNNIIIKSFNQLGFNLSFCIANFGFAKSNAGPVNKILTSLFFAPLRWLYLIIKYFLMPSHDLIYVPYPSHLDAWIGVFLARIKKRKIIIDAFMGLYDTIVRDRQLINSKNLFARLIWFYEKTLFHSVDMILVDTKEHSLMFQEDFDINQNKVADIPVGIDETLWVPSKYPLNTNIFQIVLWSTFIPLHGVEVVAKAAKILEKELPSCHFLVIGNGQLAKQFKKLLEEIKPENLQWINQFIPLHKIKNYVEKAHCCLGIFGNQDKTQRVIPYKAYQTLASAKPLITARTQASKRIFMDCENALLVKPNDPKDLAIAIKRLANDNEFATKIGLNGRALYDLHMSNQVIKNRLRKIFESLEII